MIGPDCIPAEVLVWVPLGDLLLLQTGEMLPHQHTGALSLALHHRSVLTFLLPSQPYFVLYRLLAVCLTCCM